MPRTSSDTWDLASGVGATATMMAASRAVASRGANPLIRDPFAEPLVRAVGVDFFTRLASGEVNLRDNDDGSASIAGRIPDDTAVRTRFYDDFFLAAGKAGIRQAVILASGLDARAYRLPWPADTRVYEIDQPAVIDFKTATLSKLHAAPIADRRAVGVDLREDWPAALRRAGFDAAQATAWSAELLLVFLPPDAQDRLLDYITALSAPGSRFASENLPNVSQVPAMQKRMHAITRRAAEQGFDLDIADLIYSSGHNDVINYLSSHGWQTTEATLARLYHTYGLTPQPYTADNEHALDNALTYVSATRRSPSRVRPV
jgi:methyltransferase (TIGR00027 family)